MSTRRVPPRVLRESLMMGVECAFACPAPIESGGYCSAKLNLIANNWTWTTNQWTSDSRNCGNSNRSRTLIRRMPIYYYLICTIDHIPIAHSIGSHYYWCKAYWEETFVFGLCGSRWVQINNDEEGKEQQQTTTIEGNKNNKTLLLLYYIIQQTTEHQTTRM